MKVQGNKDVASHTVVVRPVDAEGKANGPTKSLSVYEHGKSAEQVRDMIKRYAPKMKRRNGVSPWFPVKAITRMLPA